MSNIRYNAFEQENLTKINNTKTNNTTVFEDLINLIDTGEKQFHTFWYERLMTAEVPLNNPRKFEDQKTEKKRSLFIRIL